MPTCAELAKRIDQLEALFKGRCDEVVTDLVRKCSTKLSTEPNIVELKGEMEALIKSVDMLNSLVEDARAQNISLTSANKELKAENQALTKRLSELEQHSRINNVEIKGVVCTQGESCLAIMKAVGEKICCPISEDDIDVVHRVPTRSGAGNKNIIARFCSRAKKQDFIAKARKARLNSKDLGYAGPNHVPIYINDHLTRENKVLFAKAQSLKRDKGWQFLWTENCQIKARKTCDSRVYRISTEGDLSVFR